MGLRAVEKEVYRETAKMLRGGERRIFMARIVKMLGVGGQRLAERELGWNRGTIRRGLQELERGKPFPARFSARGRKRVEENLPNLLEDIRDLMEGLLKEDAVYQQTGYYTGVSAGTIRSLLIVKKGYADQTLPTKETIRAKMKQLNYHFRRSYTR